MTDRKRSAAGAGFGWGQEAPQTRLSFGQPADEPAPDALRPTGGKRKTPMVTLKKLPFGAIFAGLFLFGLAGLILFSRLNAGPRQPAGGNQPPPTSREATLPGAAPASALASQGEQPTEEPTIAVGFAPGGRDQTVRRSDVIAALNDARPALGGMDCFFAASVPTEDGTRVRADLWGPCDELGLAPPAAPAPAIVQELQDTPAPPPVEQPAAAPAPPVASSGWKAPPPAPAVPTNTPSPLHPIPPADSAPIAPVPGDQGPMVKYVEDSPSPPRP